MGLWVCGMLTRYASSAILIDRAHYLIIQSDSTDDGYGTSSAELLDSGVRVEELAAAAPSWSLLSTVDVSITLSKAQATANSDSPE